MRILTENIPATLAGKSDVLRSCLDAFNATYPVRRVWLFGSHARGVPHADSDVDLCIVADGFDSQSRAAQDFRRAISHIRGKPPLTLIPISTARLREKEVAHDPFFETVLQEGIILAEED